MRIIRFSDLKLMGKSPAHYHARMTGPAGEATRAMKIGSAAHRLVLGQGPGRAIVRFEGEARRGKEWAAFEAANPDADILTAPEWADAEVIASAVAASPAAQDVLRGARYEVPLDWEMCGMACTTGGIDIVGADYIADLKTAQTSEPGAFGRAAFGMSYHAQLAFYAEAARQNGLTVDRALVVAVESSAPHCVTVLRLAPELLEHGAQLCRLWLERLKACMEADEWPGYAQSPVEWSLPAWLGPREESDDDA